MKLAATLTAAMILAAAGSASAEPNCAKPTPPEVPNGAQATLDEMQAAKKAVIEFLSASDAYQQCVIDDVTRQREEAKAAKKKIDPQAPKTASALTAANQADKEKVGNAYNEASKAFRAAHPG